jgi:predicted nucleic acid-binding protein
MAPDDALTVLRSTFFDRAVLIALDEAAYRSIISNAPANGVVGGRVYDALIAACAVQANVNAVLTFNARDFRPLLPDSIDVIVPGE